MKEIIGDLFSFVGSSNAICITTNGALRKDTSAVMGRGVALQAQRLYPGIDLTLGWDILTKGLRVSKLKQVKGTWIVSFPVKPTNMRSTGLNVVKHMRDQFPVGSNVPGWACKAQLDVIRTSVAQLFELANMESWEKIVLPCPGCGAGELQWVDVRPIVSFLDDRFAICFKESK